MSGNNNNNRTAAEFTILSKSLSQMGQIMINCSMELAKLAGMDAQEAAATFSVPGNIAKFTSTMGSDFGIRKSEEKKKRKKKDPLAPKKPETAFFLFQREKRPEVYAKNPNLKADKKAFGDLMAKMWKNTSEETKKSFQARYEANKAIYERNRKKYEDMVKDGKRDVQAADFDKYVTDVEHSEDDDNEDSDAENEEPDEDNDDAEEEEEEEEDQPSHKKHKSKQVPIPKPKKSVQRSSDSDDGSTDEEDSRKHKTTTFSHHQKPHKNKNKN